MIGPITDLVIDAHGSRFRLRGVWKFVCPLAGEHQVENARVAAIALSATRRFAGWNRRHALAGRLELVSERPEIIIDGAHNPAGTRALAAYIRRFYSGRRIWLVYGALRDKAVSEMTSILFPLADRVILTAPRIPGRCRRKTSRRLALASRIPSLKPSPLLDEAAPEDVDLHRRFTLPGGRGAGSAGKENP